MRPWRLRLLLLMMLGQVARRATVARRRRVALPRRRRRRRRWWWWRRLTRLLPCRPVRLRRRVVRLARRRRERLKERQQSSRQFGGTGALVRGRRQAGLQCLCKSVDWLSEGGRREVVVDGRPGYVSVVGRSTVNRLDASKRLHEAQAKGKHVDGWPVLVAQGHLGSLVTFGAADGHAASPNNVAGLDRCGRNERVVVAHVAGEPQVGQHGSNGATGSVEGHDALLVGCVGEQEDVVPFDVAV
mmetsp:Transcript_14815/g.46448  ORF Transcript_14815/g.46448 Transcript_14815/m.46448 type:complete len:243 (-) Transcript_14815:536-1264(-)